jgi:hypothetical protein
MKKNLLLLLIIALGLFTINKSSAQISFTAINVPYTQNFDALFGDVTVFFSNNDANFPGFYSFRTVGEVQPQEFRRSTLGVSTSNIGRFYNSGNSTAPTERALVLAYSSACGTLTAGFRFVNNTGKTITSLDVAYTGEQWRIGGSAGPPISVIANTLDFEYQQAVAFNDITSGAYIPYPSLSFTSPNLVFTPIQTAIDGNLPENRTAITSTITVNIPVGEEIMLRWIDQTDDAGFDHQLGIDDISVTPRSLITDAPNLSSSKSGLTIYPNPAKDVLNVVMKNTEVASIEIFDITGRRVQTSLLDADNTEVNVTSLPKGLYMVRTKGSGNMQTSKFIKN